MAAGYKDFTAGAVLTAADLEDYNQNQSIMRFATAAARDAALTTVKTEGMMAYLIDVNTLTVYSGAAWSTVGPVHAAQTAWVPVITQSGTVTYTATSATYMRIGRKVFFEAVLGVTGTGSASNVVTVTLPVTALSSNVNTILGSGYIIDSSAPNIFYGMAVIASTTTLKIMANASGAVSPTYQGVAGFTAALASTDVVSVQGSYEAAGDA